MESAVQCMSFLDVCIKVNNDNIETWIWRKPTHTGLLLSYNVNCPKKWNSCLMKKLGISILCLLIMFITLISHILAMTPNVF